MARRKPPLDLDGAESLALLALGFLAEEPERLGRFLALSGMGPDDLRQEAGEPGTLAAVLGYLLDDESLLQVFASMKEIDPADVQPAQDLLANAAARGQRA
jgi:hypothetical protein